MTAAAATEVRRRRTASPDSLAASFIFSCVATAGLFYVNIMAALVTGLQDALHFSARDAGLVGSANVYGAAAGALLAVLLVRRLDWRRAALVSLLLLIGIDLGSILISSPLPLIGARFVHGLAGGFVVGATYGVIARTRTPDRTFGLLLFIQFGFGGLGLMFLPRLVGLFGTASLFLALAAFSLASLALLPFAPEIPPPPAASAERRPVNWAPLSLALAALFLFQAGNMGLAAYIIDLGRAYGLETGRIAFALGVANWMGLLGALPVVALGLKLGRWPPILFGLCATLAGVAAFCGSADLKVFFAANVVTAVTWAFVVPYLLGLSAAFDKVGRTAALAGFVSKMGLASGPAAAAFLIQGRDFPRLIVVSLAALVLCLFAAAWPAMRLDRERPD